MEEAVWESKLDATHRRVMSRAETVAHYTRMDYIDPGEQLVYNAAGRDVAGEPVLDLGVGGGRTVGALTAISSRYVAVDYAPEMVEATRKRYPNLEVHLGDARHLPDFTSDTFGLVVFSCAGLDMVGTTDRTQILREVLRLLRPGGLFAFSTHNWQYRKTHAPPLIELAPEPWQKPARFLRRLASELRHVPMRVRNRMSLSNLEQRSEEWAVLNSPYHDFSTLMCYVTLSEQRAQLQRVGFEPAARAATNEGTWISTDRVDDTAILHVLARKPDGR